MAHPGGRPLKFKNVQELENAIEAYFISCEDPEKPGFYIKPLTITSLAVYLDTSRETLLDYQERDEFSDAIKKAKQKIHAWTEEQLYRTTQVTGVIFNLKNNYGWKDKSEQENTVKLEVNDLRDLSDDELDRLINAGLGGKS